MTINVTTILKQVYNAVNGGDCMKHCENLFAAYFEDL